MMARPRLQRLSRVVLLGASALSLSGCIAAAAIPIVAGGGAIFRDGVSDDARGGGDAARGEVTVSQAPPTPAMVAQPAPTPTPSPAPALARAELAEPGFDTLPAPAPALDPIPAPAPAQARLTTPAFEPAPVPAPVSTPTPAPVEARMAPVEVDPAPIRRGPEPVIVLTLPASAAASTPAPAPAPAPPVVALAPEPVPEPTRELAPEPAPEPAPAASVLAVAEPEPIAEPAAAPAPEPAVDLAAEFADLVAPEPEPVPAPAPEPEPAPPALAAVELPPARVSPAPAPVATPAPAPAPTPAPVQPLGQPPVVEPPVVAPVEEPQGQALIGYAALRSYVLRTLGGGLPLPSAVLADPTTLQPVRSNCSGNAPTIVIDLDPAGGLVPLSGPLNLNNALARVLTELRARDVNVAWVTDRTPLDARAVRDRLVASGLDPQSRDSLYVERYPGETKQSRREAIGQTSCIIAMAGDERADFDDLYNFLIDYSDARALEPMVGTGWFLIDNPVGE